MLHKSHKAIEVNISELSPIETLYFKFLQFVRLGELEDVKTINKISPEAKRVVPSEFVDRMELWANTPILVDGVRKFIQEETDKIAHLVYLNMEITGKELDSIRQSEKQVIRILENKCCEILTEIYSCSSVSEMLSVHNDYYDNRYNIIDSIFE